MPDDKKFFEYILKEIKSKDNSKTRLAIIYRYLGEENKSIELLRSITDFEMPDTRFNVVGITEEDKKDTHFLIGVGKNQLIKGIRFNLARWHTENAKRFFEWASENCFIPENTFKEWTDIQQFDEIAVGYLWRGYALLMLGKYNEAYELLKQVPVYFNKEKLTGGEVWQVYEPKLVRALLPLCEYKLNPSEENRMKARRGLEDYIKSFGEPKFKLEGYLYYYHLKEMFPEVYSETIVPGSGAGTMKGEHESSNLESISPDMRGAVIVSDVNRYYLDVFGTNKDLVEYIGKVKGLGNYPLLSGLMDVYAIEDTAGFEAVPLIEECNRLLKTVKDPWLKEKTRAILEIATKALDDESGVILYYDPDLDLSKF